MTDDTPVALPTSHACHDKNDKNDLGEKWSFTFTLAKSHSNQSYSQKCCRKNINVTTQSDSSMHSPLGMVIMAGRSCFTGGNARLFLCKTLKSTPQLRVKYFPCDFSSSGNYLQNSRKTCWKLLFIDVAVGELVSQSTTTLPYQWEGCHIFCDYILYYIVSVK